MTRSRHWPSARVEAAAGKRIPAKKLADLFKALGLAGAVFELG